MKILALDLGTDTGYAYGDTAQKTPTLGHWNLATAKEVTAWGKTRLTRRSDPRIHRLHERLQHWTAAPNIPDLVIFEDVQFQTYTFQVQLWSSFRAAVWLTFPNTLIDCVPVATLKKFATGSGFAKKENMMAALLKLSPSVNGATLTDDEADAAWLWHWAAKHHRGL